MVIMEITGMTLENMKRDDRFKVNVLNDHMFELEHTVDCGPGFKPPFVIEDEFHDETYELEEYDSDGCKAVYSIHKKQRERFQ